MSEKISFKFALANVNIVGNTFQTPNFFNKFSKLSSSFVLTVKALLHNIPLWDFTTFIEPNIIQPYRELLNLGLLVPKERSLLPRIFQNMSAPINKSIGTALWNEGSANFMYWGNFSELISTGVFGN